MPISHQRRLFVTGAAGFLGRSVVAAATGRGWGVDGPTSAQLDLRVEAAVATIVAAEPDTIVHTAYRRDDRASIVDATRHVATAAHRSGARLVHVSTDVVFGGRPAPYTEADPTDPVHDYGRAKADAERIVTEVCPDAVIVRTSLIHGRAEPSVHELAVRDTILGESDMAFFTDEVRSPVYVDALAEAIVDLAERREIAGPLHLGGPESFSRAELATLTARHHGWDASKLRFTTIEATGLARAAHVVLDSGRARSLGITVEGPTADPT